MTKYRAWKSKTVKRSKPATSKTRGLFPPKRGTRLKLLNKLPQERDDPRGPSAKKRSEGTVLGMNSWNRLFRKKQPVQKIWSNDPPENPRRFWSWDLPKLGNGKTSKNPPGCGVPCQFSGVYIFISLDFLEGRKMSPTESRINLEDEKSHNEIHPDRMVQPSYRWWFRNPRRSPVEGKVVYPNPIIYRVSYIPGGCLGFLNHQQYVTVYHSLPYWENQSDFDRFLCLQSRSFSVEFIEMCHPKL